MAKIREVANQISSVTSTQQITKAMKMVAASKLNKVQGKVSHVCPYVDKLAAVLETEMSSTELSCAQKYVKQHTLKKVLIVVITSDRGLCGSFNTNVIKKATSYMNELANNKDGAVSVDILPIGKKAFDFFEKRGGNLIQEYVALSSKLDFESSNVVASFLIDVFLKHNYDKIVLAYNHFKSIATQVPVIVPFLPVIVPAISTKKAQVDYICEPSKKEFIEELVPMLLKGQFYKVFLESNASENSARMLTMNKATDNASELLKSLKLAYNRTRQAIITQEISEIVSGAAGLAG